MNTKEQIKELIIWTGPTNEEGRERVANQILDLVLNALTIEKKEYQITPEGEFNFGSNQKTMGWNNCIDAYEELKNKLRN